MSVLVCIPVKNCAAWLPCFFQKVDRLDDVSRVVLIYGESLDSTLDVITQWMVMTEHDVELYREPPRMNAQASSQIGAIYRDFQEIMAHGDETHALLLDSDVLRMPANLIQRLQKYDKDIIAPYTWLLYHEPGKCFYDTYCFRLKNYRYHPFNPPMNNNELIQLDSVGTCILVKRRVFLEVPYRDHWPHMNFCNDARIQGYEVWADPKTSVDHVDLTRFGILHVPFTLQGDPADRTPMIKDDGSIVKIENFSEEYSSMYIWGEIFSKK